MLCSVHCARLAGPYIDYSIALCTLHAQSVRTTVQTCSAESVRTLIVSRNCSQGASRTLNMHSVRKYPAQLVTIECLVHAVVWASPVHRPSLSDSI